MLHPDQLLLGFVIGILAGGCASLLAMWLLLFQE